MKDREGNYPILASLSYEAVADRSKQIVGFFHKSYDKRLHAIYRYRTERIKVDEVYRNYTAMTFHEMSEYIEFQFYEKPKNIYREVTPPPPDYE